MQVGHLCLDMVTRRRHHLNNLKGIRMGTRVHCLNLLICTADLPLDLDPVRWPEHLRAATEDSLRVG